MTEQTKHPNYEWIMAFAEGKQLQWRSPFTGDWMDFRPETEDGPWADMEVKWRVKPETRWYRVALVDVGLTTGPWPTVAYSAEGEERAEDMHGFIRWLTDRIEYDV